jgi:hypothetical protein
MKMMIAMLSTYVEDSDGVNDESIKEEEENNSD